MPSNVDLGPTSQDWLDVAAVGADVTVYQRKVKHLIENNRQLRTQLNDERRAHREEVRALRSQLAEGLTPELLTLRRTLAACKQRLHAAEARLAEHRRKHA